jgi:hypothetical protein
MHLWFRFFFDAAGHATDVHGAEDASPWLEVSLFWDNHVFQLPIRAIQLLSYVLRTPTPDFNHGTTG